MRETLLPIVLHLMLVAAGLGVLRVAGARPTRAGEAVAMVGLAYLLGLASVLAIVVLLLVIGVPFTLPTVLIVAAGLAAPAFLAAPQALRGLRRPTGRELRSFPVVGGVVVALVWIWALGHVSEMPLTNWDGWAIWTYKARIFEGSSHIPLALFQSADKLPIPEIAPGLFPVSHFDYPLGLPLWEAAQFRAVGSPDTSQVMAILWILLPAWAGGAVALAPRNAPRIVVLPVVAATTLLLISPLFDGIADVPLAMFLSLGVLAMGRWLQHRARPDLIVAVVLFGGAALFKNEGIIGTGVIFVALLIALARDRPGLRAAVIAGALWLVAFVLPWKLWLVANGVHGDLPFSRVLNPAFLIDNLSRFSVIGDWAGRTVTLGNLCSVTLVAIAILAITRGPAPRIRLFASLSLAFYAATLVLVYWVTAHDLYWHIGNSSTRVMMVLGMIGVSTILLVTEPAPEGPAPRAEPVQGSASAHAGEAISARDPTDDPAIHA